MPIRDFVLPPTDTRAEVFERWHAEPWEPPVPKPAATVILVRDGATGVEVFLQRRVGTMAFAPNRYVFPGGSVDAGDHDPLPWGGPSPQEWAPILGAPPDVAHGLVAAAVRELFEESGVLLAAPADADAALPPEALAAARRRLLDREVSLSAVLGELGLVVRTDLLGFFAHWVTPAFEPRRYDTYFFTALVPPGQVADAETTEADRADWTVPNQVLADPDGMLMPPTMVCLEHLAAAASAAAIVARRAPVPVVQPTAHRLPDGWAIRAELP